MVLGSLFHDLGHIIAIADEKRGIRVVENMAGCGAKDHEHIGGDYLRTAGFSQRVEEICRGHVKAKRYFCWKDPKYHQKLSEASKTTLKFQGGPMKSSEGKEFEKDPNFQAILDMRKFDETAKIPGLKVPKIEDYSAMMRANLIKNS